jgi:hypothetical protein
MKITKEQQIKMQKAASREQDLKRGWGNFKHKAHKSARDFNRKKEKKVVFD